MLIRACVCQWKVSAVMYISLCGIQTPHVWTACGAHVPPPVQKHSCCCLPHWRWSGRLQPARSTCRRISGRSLAPRQHVFQRKSSRRTLSLKDTSMSWLIFVSQWAGVTASGWHGPSLCRSPSTGWVFLPCSMSSFCTKKWFIPNHIIAESLFSLDVQSKK